MTFGEGQTFDLSSAPFLTARRQALAVGHGRERGPYKAGEHCGGGELDASLVAEL